MTTVSDEILGKLARQQSELFDRVRRGKLDPVATSMSLQRIIEGKGAGLVKPAWYRTPEQQLDTLEMLHRVYYWPFKPSDFIEPPLRKTPPTPNAVLMAGFGFFPDQPLRGLTGLQETFDALSKRLEVPGFGAWRWPGLKSDPSQLTLQDGYDWQPGVRWLWFDPTTYRGVSPQVALELSKADGVRLAGVEVMMAAILFPGWVRSWGNPDEFRPNMTGLRYRNYDGVSCVPYLFERRDDKQLRLDVTMDTLGLHDYASPTVWKC